MNGKNFVCYLLRSYTCLIISLIIAHRTLFDTSQAMYCPAFLRSLRYANRYKLSLDVRNTILELNIKKQPNCALYRRSRGGQKHVKRITTLVSKAMRKSKWRGFVDTRNHVTPKIDKNHDNLTSYTKLKLAAVNVRSIRQKVEQFQEYVLTQDFDVCTITETWLSKDPDGLDANLLTPSVPPDGYNILSTPRSNGKVGGGIAVVYRKSLNLKLHREYDFSEMECTDYTITCNGEKLHVCLIYRPPSGSISTFLEQLGDYFEINIQRQGHLVLLGDFNIKTDLIDSESSMFIDTLDTFNLKNHVEFPTHVKGHHLDLVLADQTSPILQNVLPGHWISDHCFVECNINIKCEKPVTKQVKYRRLHKINKVDFHEDIKSGLADMPDINSLEVKVDK